MKKTSDEKYILELDSRLVKINAKELSVTETEFCDAIKGYKLFESLDMLSLLSVNLFNGNFSNKQFYVLSRGGVRHESGIFITQFAIEYLANMFLISGSNDFKSESLKNKDNMYGLFNIYQNCLATKKYDVKNEGIASLLIPMSFEQFRSQQDPKYMFVRQLYLFNKIHSSKKIEDGVIDLEAIFFKETGLTITEFLKLSFLFFAVITQQKPHFSRTINFDGTTTSFDDVLSQDKVDKFIDILSSDSKSFCLLDKTLNSNFENNNTKTRFNPLWKKPIIILKDGTCIVPSLSAYFSACFDGLFWFFDEYFRDNDEEGLTKFRKYFGKSLYEEYVGDNLKHIYGKENVYVGIKYGKGLNSEFFDWIVKKDGVNYLFEAKAYQFSLPTLQTGSYEGVKKEIDKVVDTIIQMYKRVRDIDLQKELEYFKGGKNIPIAVFYKVPFISGPMYEDLIKEGILKIKDKYPGIETFEYYMMDISELEIFYHASNHVKINDLLAKVKNDHQGGFSSEVNALVKEKGNRGKSLIEENFDSYFDGLTT